MSKQNNLTDFLTDVADAIRQKKGTQAPINPQDFSSEIASIPTGGNNPLQYMLDRSSDTDGSYLFYTNSSGPSIFSKLTYENLITLDFSSKHYTNTSEMFSYCTSLTTIPQLDFSSVISANSMFNVCTSLTTLDFSNIKTIEYQFASSSSLSTLIIRNSTTLATLGSTNAFPNTPIAAGTGYIYVPDNLVDSYKQATNWSTFANQIKPLSELPQGE